jgi:phage tail-like protein
MPNSRDRDPFVASRFRIEIDGLTVGVFAAVGGLETRTDVVEYVDGSDLLVRKRPGRTRYANIVLKRGMIGDNDELWAWYKAVTDGQMQRRSGSIIVLGDDGSTEKVRYNFFDAWPCRWKSLELDGAAPSAVIEEIELVVEKIERA